MSSKVSNKIPKNIKSANQRHIVHGQFQYLGRWVNKDQFRAYVYNDKGEQKLADSYHEFQTLTTSGLWFAERPECRKQTIEPKVSLKSVEPHPIEIKSTDFKETALKETASKERKQKNDTIRPAS